MWYYLLKLADKRLLTTMVGMGDHLYRCCLTGPLTQDVGEGAKCTVSEFHNHENHDAQICIIICGLRTMNLASGLLMTSAFCSGSRFERGWRSC